MTTPALNDRLRADLTEAMKSKDSVAVSTIRSLLTSIRNAEVSGEQQSTLTDEQVVAVLQSEAKKRKEAAQIYADAGRAESAAEELAQYDVIERYLPEQMSPEELAGIVDEEVERVQSTNGDDVGPKLMGPVIAAVKQRVGDAADGAVIAAAVKARLNS